MADTKKSKRVTTQKVFEPLFTKENYLWMIIGGAIIALGMFLMSGGENHDPNATNVYSLIPGHGDYLYSFRRVTLAPILIIAGIVVEVYAIFKKSKKSEPAE